MNRIHIFDNHYIPKRFQHMELYLISEGTEIDGLCNLYVLAGKTFKIHRWFGLEIPDYEGRSFNVRLSKKQYIIVPQESQTT